jgi:hypothetical protein
MDPVWNIVIPSGCGLLAGVIGSLFAPWVQWGIEKRRKRLERRQCLINDCREHLDASEFNGRLFRETAVYAAIRPELPAPLVKDFEGDVFVVQVGGRGAGDANRRRLLDEVSRLERKWKLV